MVKSLFIVICGAAFLISGCSGGDGEEGPCKGVDCSGHGDCVEVGGEASCDCDSGYRAEGLTCVEDVDPCDGVTCSGHGTCIISGGNAACDCEAGYHHVTGPDCEENGPCYEVICSGHGTCVDNLGTPECQCDAGYHADGLHCLPDADPCQGETCSGHGTCVLDNDGYPECQCDAGYRPVGLECVEEGDWPPTLESLYVAGTGCMLPACDTNGAAGVDLTGTWQRTLTTTSSDCGAVIQGVDNRAKVGNVVVESPIELTAFDGTCDINDEQEHVGTIENSIIASCESNVQTLNIVSFETGIVVFTATDGTGVARIFLTEVPAYLGGDCEFEMNVYYEKL